MDVLLPENESCCQSISPTLPRRQGWGLVNGGVQLDYLDMSSFDIKPSGAALGAEIVPFQAIKTDELVSNSKGRPPSVGD